MQQNMLCEIQFKNNVIRMLIPKSFYVSVCQKGGNQKGFEIYSMKREEGDVTDHLRECNAGKVMASWYLSLY